MKKITLILLSFVIVCVAGCTTISRSYLSPYLSKKAKWIVFPLRNNTETPLAGLRAQAITAGVLRSRGIYQVTSYQTTGKFKDYLPGSQNVMSNKTMLRIAGRNGATYAVVGSVNEWRYKIGIDGEPAAGVGLEVLNVHSGHVVWSAVGGTSGHSQQALSYTGQQLIQNLLFHLPLR